jgi:hypothetical protein
MGNRVDFEVKVRGRGAFMAPRTTAEHIEIRIAAARPPNEGMWEWAVVEELRDILTGNPVERHLLANDIAPDHMTAAMSAGSAMAAVLAARAKTS